MLQQTQAALFMIFKSIQGTALQSANLGNAFQPDVGGGILANSTASRLSASTIETNPHRNYVMQWNLNVQRQITSDTTLTVGYIGSRGGHLLIRGDDGNMPLPTRPSARFLFPCR